MIVSNTQELQQALNTALPADTIKLKGNDYTGHFNIRTPGIKLCSADPNNPAKFVDDRPATHGIEHFSIQINASAVTLSNLYFTSPNGITIRVNESHCTLKNLRFEYVKIAFICSAPKLTFKNIRIRHFSEDGIRLASDGFYGENIIIEDLHDPKGKAHHDGIQLYAGKPNTALRHAGRYEGKYALNKGTLKTVTIRSTTDITRSDIGKLQGIFSSDGFMDGIQLSDINIITHNCIHGVSLRGIRTALDGTPSHFENVTVKCTPGITSKPPQIRLIPARRLTPEGMVKYKQVYTKSIDAKPYNPIELAADESNLSDVLFPPPSFRTNDDESSVISKSIDKPDWACIPEGSFDAQQGRTIQYRIHLTNNNAETVKNFSCDGAAPIPKNNQGSTTMNRAKFYECIRKKPFNGRLMQKQVDGMEVILNEWENRGLKDTRCLAYILATAFHETAHTMQPIAEYGKGRGRRYGTPHRRTGHTYYGRGYVQITWYENYERFSKHMDIDLVNNPDKALDTEIATKIIFDGMFKGMFTGRKLSHYFREESDWFNARKIVNRLDKAERIGRYGRQFWYAILMAQGEYDKAQAVPKSIDPVGNDLMDAQFSEEEELAKEFR